MTALTEASLIAAEHARRDANRRHDIAALKAMTADTFYYAHISGLVEQRDAYFDRLALNQVTWRNTTARDMTVRFRPGYALLSGISLLDFKNAASGEEGVWETLFLSVWEQHDGKWLISAYASTPLPRG